jgi:predicted Rossmann fold flavoprotein
MMAAGTAASRGCRVTLLDPGGCGGRKLALTGKGRCNLTNDSAVEVCLAHIPRNPRFLYSALSAFPPAAVMAFFETLGVPLQTERGRRVFPVSGRAGDVVAALTDWLTGLGVFVRAGRVTGILHSGGAVCGAETAAGAVACDALVVATGGLSYPKTGSTGDGYRLAVSVGHTVRPPMPSLVPLLSPAPYCGAMAGLSLRHVALTAYDNEGQKRYTGFGEMLFTHTGVSGPLVLSASAHLEGRAAGGRLSIDLKPALSEEALDRRLLRDFEAYANRDFQNALGDLLHKKMIPVIIELSGIRPEKKVHSVSRAERAALLALCKDFPVPVSGPASIDAAVVTAGGVDVRALKPATMESRVCAGLYFAGEVIDVDAYTGGFNLQIAWSTGRAAGCGAAGNKEF